MAKKQKFRRIAAEDDEDGDASHSNPPRRKNIDFAAEARLFFNLAAPNVLIQVFGFMLWMENSMYVGRTLGTTELAAVSLGNMCGNLTGLSLIFGMLSAMDTLAPQAVGSKRFAEVGVLEWRKRRERKRREAETREEESETRELPITEDDLLDLPTEEELFPTEAMLLPPGA